MRRTAHYLRILVLMLAALQFISVATISAEKNMVSSSAAQTWVLSWSDEFNGPTGSRVDSAKWSYDTGGDGWGNHELENYTSFTRNSFIDGNGALVIKAFPRQYPKVYNCWYGVCRYSSARLLTATTFTQAYGRFEARLKVPSGQGVWPAFWMLGADIGTVGWPNCGEVDIMENIGREPGTIHGTIHGPGYSGGSGIGAPYALGAGQNFADDFHIFAVEWEPNVVRWYVDGTLYQTRTPADLPQGTAWVFNHPFFIIMNLAIGGDWPGSPDLNTLFPLALYVDYVRVYQRPALAPKR